MSNSPQQPKPTPLVYIASKLENAPNVQALRDALKERGIGVTYDWTTHGPVWREGAARIRQVSELEIDGVLQAWAVLVLLPGGRGTHAELGAALACAFYHHPLVTPIPVGVPFHGPAVDYLAEAIRAKGSPRITPRSGK